MIVKFPSYKFTAPKGLFRWNVEAVYTPSAKVVYFVESTVFGLLIYQNFETWHTFKIGSKSLIPLDPLLSEEWQVWGRKHLSGYPHHPIHQIGTP